LNKLAGIYGKAFRKEVFEPCLMDVKTGFVVTINGVLIGQLRGVDARLNEGNNVILMALMIGCWSRKRLQFSWTHVPQLRRRMLKTMLKI